MLDAFFADRDDGDGLMEMEGGLCGVWVLGFESVTIVPFGRVY